MGSQRLVMDQLLSAIYATIHSMPRNHSSKKAETDEIAEREWIHLLKEVGIREEDSLSLGTVLRDAEQPSPEAFNHKSFALTLIAGGFAAFNVFALASLYPVLRGRGAPYLPTKNTSLDKMFAQLRADKKFQTTFMGTESHTKLSRPNFADLGSGDGRVVFRAAREGLFSCSQGYEINPMLHGFAQLRKLMTPKYWRTTNFYLGDIWKVDLTNVDVVAVVSFLQLLFHRQSKPLFSSLF